MDLLLTSFGLGMQSFQAVTDNDRPVYSLFYRMPPLMLEERGTFRLDYSALFMFDRVIVDEQTYQRAIDPLPDIDPDHATDADDDPELAARLVALLRRSAAQYADVLQALKSSGRLVTKDFDSRFTAFADLWETATKLDLRNVPSWAEPLRASLMRWDEIQERMYDAVDKFWEPSGISGWMISSNSMLTRPHSATPYDYAHHILDPLKNWKRRLGREQRDEIKMLLRNYLAYVNFNLLLARDCEAAFMDWEDMQPFYDRKFELAGHREWPGVLEVQQSRKLFELLFPYFVPKSPRDLIRAIESKQVDELRRLIEQSVAGAVEFDQKFAVRTLKEVLKFEHKAIARRRICGWATMPLGLIPVVGSVVEKVAQEVLDRVWGNKPLAKYAWFYVINELDTSSKKLSVFG